MAKLTKNTLFKPALPRAETQMDKTTRAARLILDEEATARQTRTERLRKTRLERDASNKAEAAKAEPKATGKKTRAKPKT